MRRATETVIRNAQRFGLRTQSDDYGNTVYASPKAHRQWRSVNEEVEYVFAERANPRRDTRTSHQKAEAEGAGSANQSSRHETNDNEQRHQHNTNFDRVVETVLRSCRTMGAIGQSGFRATKKAIELYQAWARPIWHVSGNAYAPKSVAKLVRDLQPRTRRESHRAAVRAMFRWRGSLQDKLRHAEMVYRKSRRPKRKIPRRSLIVIRGISSARPKDVTILLRLAKRAKAKTVIVDRTHSKSVLRQAAREVRPGETRYYSEPERSR